MFDWLFDAEPIVLGHAMGAFLREILFLWKKGAYLRFVCLQPHLFQPFQLKTLFSKVKQKQHDKSQKIVCDMVDIH